MPWLLRLRPVLCQYQFTVRRTVDTSSYSRISDDFRQEQAMGIDETGMEFHVFRRFRKTWLRGERCQQDVNNFWMKHQPEKMPELYFTMTNTRQAQKCGLGGCSEADSLL
jgi:hypothetical protein